MISVADRWSRMLTGFVVAKDELAQRQDGEEDEEREEDPDPPPSCSQVVPAAPARCRRRPRPLTLDALVPSPASSPNAAARIPVLGQLVAR